MIFTPYQMDRFISYFRVVGCFYHYSSNLLYVLLWVTLCPFYVGCSNMNASGFITFFTYKLRQNGKRFYKGLYVTFKVAPN